MNGPAVTATAFVVIENVAETAPDAILTVAGTVAAALPLARATVAPTEGAFPFNVTVPVEVPPPMRSDGLTANDARTAGSTFKTDAAAV